MGTDRKVRGDVNSTRLLAGTFQFGINTYRCVHFARVYLNGAGTVTRMLDASYLLTKFAVCLFSWMLSIPETLRSVSRVAL